MSVLELFCQVDDFCNQFLPAWQKKQLTDGTRKRRRASRLCASEIITLLVLFQRSGYRNFKAFYLLYASVHLRGEFPGLLSYSRFVELVPSALVPLSQYLRACLGECSGVSYVDSTPLRVCHNARIHSHRVFAGQAARGKTSTGWFFGFKLHLVINEAGEILALTLTPGNVDDRAPVPELAAGLFGRLFGDKGYLSRPLAEQLRDKGVTLITRRRRNMKSQADPLPLEDARLLRKRGLIDSVIGQLKHKEQIEHSRHRKWTGLLANLFAGLVAYCLRDDKPSIVQRAKMLTA